MYISNFLCPPKKKGRVAMSSPRHIMFPLFYWYQLLFVASLEWFDSLAGHYRHYPVNYKAAVADLLEKATVIYSQKRMHQLNGERSSMGGTCDKISESVCNLYQAAVSSNQSLRRVAIDPSDHFFLPSSVEYPQKKDAGCMQDRRKDRLIHLQDQPSISAHSVLGQVLFDVCVPKNIEDWDIKPACSLNRHTFGSSHQHSLNPTKCVRRSRL